MVWRPTAKNSDRHVYLVRADDGQPFPWLVYAEHSPRRPVYYLNDKLIYREEAHPDGQSSVPYLRLLGSVIVPAEGFPTGAGDDIYYRVRRKPRPRPPMRVRRNPKAEM
jgi:hypothetical protein